MKVSTTYFDPYLAYHALAGLGGQVPYGTYSPSPNSVACGYYGCGGADSVPGYYTAALAKARSSGYSVPSNAFDAGSGAGVEYVNPDGTVGRIFNWQVWPLQVNCVATGTANPNPSYTNDCSFKSPPQAVWIQYMNDLGVQVIADQQAANIAAITNYANNAVNNSNPGLNPSDYLGTDANGYVITTTSGGGNNTGNITGGGGLNLSTLTSGTIAGIPILWLLIGAGALMVFKGN